MTLRAENLAKNFNGVHALDGATVEFTDTGVTAIIGPNGAGKTTLVNALTGFERVDSGRSFLGAAEITSLSPERIARLGVARTFQEIRLVWRETALDNVMVAVDSRAEEFMRAATGIGIRGEDERIRTKACEALRVVGLQDQAGVLATQLSYGQQKLLALARCMATDSHWLILDEPVSGVSPALVDSILETLRGLARNGRAIVLIEHDIRAVREVADAVVVLDQGRVVTTGTSDDVLARGDVLEAYLG
jgi:ABC-type branched-subunit amino acid transport system ATPase component